MAYAVSLHATSKIYDFAKVCKRIIKMKFKSIIHDILMMMI